MNELDLEKIFTCCDCKDDVRGFAKLFKAAPNGYYQKYPPIGHGRKLFFVSTNPRRSNKNAHILSWAMESRENFKELSRNRYKCTVYTPTEGFYKIYHRISEAISPEEPLKDVAIVHELYLCATPTEDGLPWRSPCPFMGRHLDDTCPQLVLAFGKRAAKTLCCKYGGDKVLTLRNGTKVRVISLRHPNYHSNGWRWTKEREKRAAKWVKQCFDASICEPLPPRDFEDDRPSRETVGKQAKRSHSYACIRTSGTLSLIIDPCPNYQPGGDSGAQRWRLARDFARAGKTFQAATSRTGLSKSYLQYFIEKGCIAIDGLTGRDAYVAGARDGDA